MKWIVALVLTLFLTFAYPEPATEHNDRELKCLIKNIYYEARGEGYRGMLAVGKVTLNRMTNPKFPDSICKVVYQKGQFDWTKHDKALPSGTAYSEAQRVAKDLLSGDHELHDFDALYFHATRVKPLWRGKKRILTINNHVFYK